MIDEINENLEKQFQKLKPSKGAPEELKKEIFRTLDSLDLIGDVNLIVDQDLPNPPDVISESEE